jgi:hypothetical protein
MLGLMRGLVIFGLIISLYNSVMGALMLTRFYEVPGEVLPKWKFGQWLLINGLVSLGIYIPLIILCLHRRRAPRQNES